MTNDLLLDVDELDDSSPKDVATTFPIIGVGASAGGLEAFSQSLKALPEGTEDAPVREKGLRVKWNGGYREVAIEVVPMKASGLEKCGFLILFEDGVASDNGRIAKETTNEATLNVYPSRLVARDSPLAADTARLEHELAGTRDYLQSIIEQHEATNEELQSGNEEVQSACEELQSGNERLETSKEEIQSSNEELTTVNDELNDRNAELNRLNDDLENLVKMHGGTVDANSEGIGKGSEFVVRLPMEPDALEVIRDKAEVVPLLNPPLRTSATPSRILVVDDNRDSATSLAMLLKLQGYQTQTAFDGLEAVEAATTFRPQVILLDIGLPKLNGFEVCRRIREQSWGKEIVMVALTGWGQDEDRQKSNEAGFDHHLIKPVDSKALTKLLNEAIK